MIVWTDDPLTTETPTKTVHVNVLHHIVDLQQREVGLLAPAVPTHSCLESRDADILD